MKGVDFGVPSRVWLGLSPKRERTVTSAHVSQSLWVCSKQSSQPPPPPPNGDGCLLLAGEFANGCFLLFVIINNISTIIKNGGWGIHVFNAQVSCFCVFFELN